MARPTYHTALAAFCTCLTVAASSSTFGRQDIEDMCPAGREHNLTHEAKLHEDLLCGYNSDTRPVKDHKTTVTVRVSLVMKYVTFDSTEETLTVHSWLSLVWRDEFLSWSPAQYGGITDTQIRSHEIWAPRVAHFNADASMYPDDSFYSNCLLKAGGVVSCVPHVVHNSLCQSSLRRWPYDTHECDLFFGSWMHSGEQIDFVFNVPAIGNVEGLVGPGWAVVNVTNKRIVVTERNSTYPMLKYTLRLQRHAAGVAALVVAPSAVVALLTIASLLMDVRHDTRLGVACLSLFAHFTVTSEIGNELPKHGDQTPLLLLFVRDSTVVTLLAILVTLLLMWARRRRTPAPGWLVSATAVVRRGPAHYLVFTDFDTSDLEGAKVPVPVGDASDHDTAPSASEWIQFANLFNSFVFILVLFMYVILILAYIPYSAD